MFRKWARHFGSRPAKYPLPATEKDIVELLKNTKKVRVFGAGHSFNEGVVSDGTLISLDRYKGIAGKDLPNRRTPVRGGIRVREVIRILNSFGLTFSSLPSHDAQGIAGIIPTDVHARVGGF